MMMMMTLIWSFMSLSTVFESYQSGDTERLCARKHSHELKSGVLIVWPCR